MITVKNYGDPVDILVPGDRGYTDFKFMTACADLQEHALVAVVRQIFGLIETQSPDFPVAFHSFALESNGIGYTLEHLCGESFLTNTPLPKPIMRMCQIVYNIQDKVSDLQFARNRETGIVASWDREEHERTRKEAMAKVKATLFPKSRKSK